MRADGAADDEEGVPVDGLLGVTGAVDPGRTRRQEAPGHETEHGEHREGGQGRYPASVTGAASGDGPVVARREETSR